MVKDLFGVSAVVSWNLSNTRVCLYGLQNAVWPLRNIRDKALLVKCIGEAD